MSPDEKPVRETRSTQSTEAVVYTAETVTAAFAACPRCGFFLVGYRLIHDDFPQAASQTEGGWLQLSFSSPVRRLLHKSYGGRADLDAYHYEGTCPDCHRLFAYHEATEDGQPAVLRIQIKPRHVTR
ncbi:MAG: hypothetical protein L0332_08880 [Chloroflexi bacterium]|nr:hypothetical protein [Chloroflexota bacterium]MCI0576658.1 hypothetical protein [Chloroflexota bacterium]MCI0647971.1 hypothetical protein [Chloroflexota bacterium]MCI0726819.1 hypothetical protein [Chloroflexota bacterium]